MKYVLQPVHHPDFYFAPIERQIMQYFRETFFTPIIDLLAEHGISFEDTERKNAVDPLVEAIRSGAIVYRGGVFTGEFNAATSRRLRDLGAEFSRGRSEFRLRPENVPYDLRSTIADAESNRLKTLAAVTALVNLIRFHATDPNTQTGLEFGSAVDNIFSDLQKQFAGLVATIRGFEKPAVVSGKAKRFAELLKVRVDVLVKKYLSKILARILARIQRDGEKLARTGNLAAYLRALLGIFKRYAAGVARNEIGRGVADETEDFARAIGSRSYIWLTRRDWRVRPTPDYPLGDHRSLEGREFLWSSPPVTIPGTGHTAHPGKDINCRCVARLVLTLP